MRFSFLVSLFFLVFPCFSQYADLGTGSQKDKIWWFDWSGLNISNNSSKVFTTSDGLTVTATFTAVSGPTISPSVMNTWSGAVLHLLYNFSNTSIQPALLTPLNTSTTKFTLSISATRNGLPTPFTFVAADAEASVTSELLTLQTNGSNWKTIDFYRNSSQTTNPLSGCNTTTATITDTYGGSSATGQNPVIATDASASGNLVINATLSETGVSGGMAVAFGIFAPVDRGDLPGSYGYAYHKLNYNVVNPCSYQLPYPSIIPIQNIYLGSVPGDADGSQNLDDNTVGVDEEALPNFPFYDHSGVFTIKVPVVNTSGNNAYIKGWLDYNRNGVFDVNESATGLVPSNSNFVVLTWSGIPTTIPSGSTPDLGLRLRISSDQSLVQNPSGTAPDGELEDYLINSGCFSNGIDFSYSQSICSPKTFQFNNLTPNTTSVIWDFGNNTTNTVSQSPTVLYSNYGTYPVKLKVQTSAGCVDSVTKNIPVNVVQDSLIRMSDTTICRGNSVQLNTFPALNFCWNTTSGLNNSNISNPIATPTSNTTYYFTSQSTAANLVVNGDFSSGNTGFQSDYVSANPNTAAAQYYVGTNPSLWWPTFPSCGDHTTGTGNMMMVNGATIIGQKVWQQTVTITPNTNYAFSIWLKSLDPTSPANLKFSINGNILGNNIFASSTTCVWNQFFATWNSGNNTTAVITIVNNNSAFSGNDFALDDISFAQVFLKQDSVKINLVDPPVLITSSNASICAGQSTQLNVSGASNYSWSPSTGLSATNISNPVAAPINTTTYTVTGYDIPGCIRTSTVTVSITNGLTPDFSYKQDICNPLNVQFFNNASPVSSVNWDFGNNTSNIGTNNPSVNYAAFGNYRVRLKIQSASIVCVDSVVKIIPVFAVQDSLIKVADTTICKGSSIQLNTFPSLDFCWNTTTGLNNATISNPIATPLANTTYYFTSQSTGNNLVNNGDFSSGNVGFQSDYISANPNTSAAQYYIGSNPALWWPSFPSCGDHTNGTGNMMMVNGATIIGQKVWQQTVSINPNTNYAFSIWIKSLDPVSPANLKFSINNTVLGNNIQASTTTCVWDQFFATWNSGSNTTAIITVVNNNSSFSGNDFALDDISFAPVFIKKDSINITVADPPTLSITSNSSICPGDTISLNVTGASVYSWSPTNGLSNSAISNPKAYPVSTTKYYVSAYDLPGCYKIDSVTITVKLKPVITKSADVSFCEGSGAVPIFANTSGSALYNWYPVTGLSATNTSNVIANPITTTKYYVEVTGANNCKSIDSVNVSVLPVPTVDTRIDTTICKGIQTTLFTSSFGATSYSWFPTTGLSNPGVLNPVASPSSLTKYIVTASNGSCSAKDSVTIDVLPVPSITKSSDTTICDKGSAQLIVIGGSNYNWLPITGLTSSVIPNPIASPSMPTNYKVTVTGSNGCSILDSIKVDWIAKPVFSINPPSVSICVGDATTLTAAGADTYNWYVGTNISAPGSGVTSVNPTSNQNYSVAVHHNFCKLTDTLHATVIVNTLPIVTVSKSNDIDCSNASATLTATGGSSYSWTPTQNIAAANSPNPVVSPAVTTTYVVKVTNIAGCSKYDSVKVLAAFNPLSGGYNMPDAFSPNNDGKNDCFGIRYWGAIESLDFSVFNRWGEVVFRTSNPSSCWDGNFKGIPQSTGTFVYQIRAKTACGEVFKKGTVLLIR